MDNKKVFFYSAILSMGLAVNVFAADWNYFCTTKKAVMNETGDPAVVQVFTKAKSSVELKGMDIGFYTAPGERSDVLGVIDKKTITADKDYKPRKYKGFNRFQPDSDNYCGYDFLLPENFTTQNNRKAYLLAKCDGGTFYTYDLVCSWILTRGRE